MARGTVPNLLEAAGNVRVGRGFASDFDDGSPAARASSGPNRAEPTVRPHTDEGAFAAIRRDRRRFVPGRPAFAPQVLPHPFDPDNGRRL